MGQHLTRWGHAAGLLLAGVCAFAGNSAVAAERVVDSLQRPAALSARAGQALMAAVATCGKQLVAVGERGIVLRSADGGQGWTQARQVPVSVMLTAVRFAPSGKGWAVGHGGVVLRSEDCGETWSKQLDGKEIAALYLQAAQATSGAQALGAAPVAADASTRSTQLAQSTQLADAQRLVQEGADKPLLELALQDDESAIVVGAFGLALRTQDGGRHWQPWQQQVLAAKGSHLYGIQQVGETIYVAGEQGVFFRSTDGGATLAAVSTPYQGSYFGVAAWSVQDVLLYGLRGSAFLSRDAGANWTPVQTGSPASLSAGLVLADGAVLLANQAGGLLKSIDHGASFRALPAGGAVPIVGMVQAADGSVVLAGARGMRRIAKEAP